MNYMGLSNQQTMLLALLSYLGSAKRDIHISRSEYSVLSAYITNGNKAMNGNEWNTFKQEANLFINGILLLTTLSNGSAYLRRVHCSRKSFDNILEKHINVKLNAT